jgi:hypothetical protein
MLPKRLFGIAGAALAVMAASLACVGSLPGPTDAEPTGEFPTATPGGRISISLLTPTQTFPPYQGDDRQVLGPVATETALFAQSATQTAIVEGATATPAGILSAPAECPAPGNATLPAEAPAFTQLAPTLVSYLSEGGPTTVLEASLRGWGMLNEQGGLVLADRDFTADGVPEVMVIAFDPANAERFPQPGDLFIFGCDEGAYRLLYRAGFSAEEGIPQPLATADLNDTLLTNLLFTRRTCDGLVCSEEVTLVEWSLMLGSFENLLAGRVVEPFAEVEVSDLEADGVQEVLVRSGTLAALEAGPQRTFTQTWRWDTAAGLYVLSEQTASATTYRIHVIHDADAAARDGNFNDAIQLYRRAIDTTALEAWQYPNEAEHLITYARYRLMIAQVLNGQVDNARDTYDTLYNAYYDTTEDDDGPTLLLEPGVAIFQMADLWWTTYLETEEPGLACEAVTTYVRSNPSAIEVLNSFGFANPSYSAVDVCPVTPSP